jgi:hypothetical protein
MRQREFGVFDWWATMAWGAWRPSNLLGRVVYIVDLLLFIGGHLAWTIVCATATFDMQRTYLIAIFAGIGNGLVRGMVLRPVVHELGQKDPTIETRPALALKLAIGLIPVALRIGWQLAEGRPIGYG